MYELCREFCKLISIAWKFRHKTFKFYLLEYSTEKEYSVNSYVE